MKSLYNFEFIRGALAGVILYKLITLAYGLPYALSRYKWAGGALESFYYVLTIVIVVAIGVAFFALLKNPTRYIRLIVIVFTVNACLNVFLPIYAILTVESVALNPYRFKLLVNILFQTSTIISLICAYFAYLLYRMTTQPQKS